MSAKGEKSPNKLTATSGLVFNVNTVKAYMKKYFENQDVEKPVFSGSHVAITAACQKLCEMLTRCAFEQTNRDKGAVRKVNRPILNVAISMNEGLKKYYMPRINMFDKTQMYSSQFPIDKKEVDQIIHSVSSELQMSPKAYNLLCFLLNCALTDMLFTSNLFISFAKRRTLDGRAVSFAIACRFEESIAYDLKTEVDRAMKAIGETFDDTNDEEAKGNEEENAAGNDDSDVEEEEKEMKESKDKDKDSKQMKKKETKDNSNNSNNSKSTKSKDSKDSKDSKETKDTKKTNNNNKQQQKTTGNKNKEVAKQIDADDEDLQDDNDNDNENEMQNADDDELDADLKKKADAKQPKKAASSGNKNQNQSKTNKSNK